MRYYLGLDNGGTVSKAALYDADGIEICVAISKTKMITPQEGFIERNMDELWDVDCRIIRKVIVKSGIQAEDIKGVALCGHGKGLYLWGKDNCAVRNGIVSTDSRALGQVLSFKEAGLENEIFQLSGQHLIPCQPGMILRWMKENEPESLENARWIFTCKDYVRFRLTGEAYVERTESNGLLMVNIHTGEYDERLFEIMGLQDMREKMPPIVEGTKICGYITKEASESCGLVEGTPVAGGLADIFSCGVAANQIDERDVVMIAGSWSIQQLVRFEPVMDDRALLNNYYAFPGTFMIEEGSPTSAGNFEWFVNHLFPEYRDKVGTSGIYDDINAGVEKIKPQEFCPIFLPFMLGSNENPLAKGCFVGMNASHTRSHFIRGIYEGVAFSHRYHYERLKHIMNGEPRQLTLEGGAVRSRAWSQIFADVIQLPVKTLAATEPGTLGCAMVAATAVGEYKDLMSASENMCHILEEIQPIPENFAAYGKKYELYKACIEALDPVWKGISDFCDKVDTL